MNKIICQIKWLHTKTKNLSLERNGAPVVRSFMMLNSFIPSFQVSFSTRNSTYPEKRNSQLIYHLGLVLTLRNRDPKSSSLIKKEC